MKDYKESLLAGIAAAKQAAANRNEIKSVISLLNNQVHEISNSKATFGIATFYKNAESPAAQAFFSVASLMNQRIKKETYQALVIADNNEKNGIEIAEWLQDDLGYPCTIRYNGQKLFCSNKEELENSLAELLTDIHTGEAILTQMSAYDRNLESSDEGNG
ncbi:hypothetical protein [Dickeya dadantii]|uniref:hypothetical protein n=1 Tax=Dickeya dadantii TaxID=204038 RepID=UPI0011155057|nr:hypothetical protein [Dickeya dadantii]